MDTETSNSKTTVPHSGKKEYKISVAIRKGNTNKFLRKTVKNYKNNFLIVIGPVDYKKDYNPKFGNVYFVSNEKEANEMADFILKNPDIYYSAPNPLDRALSIDSMKDDILIKHEIYEKPIALDKNNK